MATKLEMLIEADKRGLLTGDKKAMFDEYMRRKNASPTLNSGDYTPNSRAIETPILEGASFGLSDEIQGGVSAIYQKFNDLLSGQQGFSDWITGKDKIDQFGNKLPGFQENYATARDQIRADQDAFEEANPNADLALKIGGGVLTGGYGGMKALGTQGVKKLGALGLPAVAAGEGAIMGFGEGEGLEESLEKAGTQAAVSAVAAPILNWGLGIAGKYAQKGLAKLKRSGVSNDIESLKLEAESFYDLADKSGIKIKPKIFSKFRKDVINILKSIGVQVAKNPRTSRAGGITPSLKRMMSTDEPTYLDLMEMRELLKNAKKSGDGSISDAAYQVSHMIDEFIEGLTPKSVSAGSTVNLGENIATAKSYWSRMQQSKTLEKAIKKAELSRTSVKDSDFDEAMSSQIRPLVDPDSRKSRGMAAEVKTKLEEMIVGTRGKNMARVGVEMDPGSATRRGISPSLGGGILAIGGYGVAGPAGILAGLIPLIPPVVGKMAKYLVNKITRKEIDNIQDALLNDGIDSVETIIRKLYSKYEPAVGGTSAALAASISEAPASTLADMISP